MADSRNFSRSVKRAAYARCGGRCEDASCRIAFPAGGGGVNYDHIVNWAISRDSSLENCQVLCSACHLKKTAGHDIPVTAKCVRIADARIGIRRTPKKKFPGGKDSDWSKTVAGPVVRRIKGRGAKHRATMASREFGGDA